MTELGKKYSLTDCILIRLEPHVSGSWEVCMTEGWKEGSPSL